MHIPEIGLLFSPRSEDANAAIGFKWAGDAAGKRSKIGGEPDFLQEEESVVCPSCAQKMTFYAQIDSVGDEVCLADVGMIYVFVCFDCFTTKSVLQSG